MTKTNAQKIREWREKHPDTRLDYGTLLDILNLDSLDRADLRGANLAGGAFAWADMAEADLAGAYLVGANLTRAKLNAATLFGTNMVGANLDHTNLAYANLCNSISGILTIDGLHPHRCEIRPTPHGWTTKIGCWSGTLDELQNLIDGDDWPDAQGEQITQRRPLLQTFINMGHAHQKNNTHYLAAVQSEWNGVGTRKNQ